MNNSKRRVLQWVSALLITAFVIQPILFALPARAAAPSNPQQGEQDTYVPFVSSGISAEISINSPKAGSLVAGTFVFSAQPLYSGGITSVDFFAGNTPLETDDSPDNGFSIELDSSEIPDGQVTLRAVAHGTRDESAQITVTNVRNPAQQTTATQSGAAVAASEIGSVIMVPPGGLPAGATMSVDEKSEQEISSEFGIQWDALGITFLGAQEVETSVPMEKPPAVSSAGFAQRVQPGQAVVNYSLAPDADGDGVAEIVVVNTARVANGNVVSDPLPEVTVGDISVSSGAQQGLAQSAQAGLHGAPGAIIEFDVTGFNLYSALGNVARFKSAVDDKEYEMPGFITQDAEDPGRQIFSTQIPLLAPGAATMTLVNLSTMDTSDPIAITVDAGPALDRPAIEIIDEYLTLSGNHVNSMAQEFPALATQFNQMAAAYTTLRPEFQALNNDPSPSAQQYLLDMAMLIQGSGILEQLAAPAASETETGPWSLHPAVAGPDLAQGCIRPNNRFNLRMMNVALGGLTLLGCVLALTGVGAVVCAAGFTAFFAAAEVAQSTIPDCPPPPPCPPSGGGGGTTGMGAAPPPGGNICGGGGGGGGGNPLASTASATGFFGQEMGRLKVFVVSDGERTAFTGSTDRGGYFFLPFVPQDKPFVAYAIDTTTGNVRSVSGIGPKTGESLMVSFDFANGSNAALENRWTGAGDGVNWEDAQNWSLGRVPGPIDKVIIDVEANPTIDFSTSAIVNSLESAEAVTLSSGSLQIVTASSMSGKLTVQNGELVINTSLTLNGPLEWTGGEISGEGKLSINGGATLSGTSHKILQGITVDNSSDFILGGNLDMLGGSGVTFNNLSGATFEFASDASYQGFYYGGLGTTFNNSGTVLKSGGGETSSLHAIFNNQGTLVEVQVGTLELRRGGNIQGGTFTVANGSFLDFASDTYTMTSSLTGNGAGQVRGTGATLTSASSATINFTNGGFAMTAGMLEGAGTLTFQGLVTLSGASSKTIVGITVNNTGTWIWIGPGNILGGGSAVFNNQVGAIFDARTNGANMTYNGNYYSGGNTTFNNNGSVIKSGDGSTATLDLCYNGTAPVGVTVIDSCP